MSGGQEEGAGEEPTPEEEAEEERWWRDIAKRNMEERFKEEPWDE